MNDDRRPVRPIDELLLDRLVDDELDAAGRRELLKALDDSPDGWRRCARAFLEAQAWRKDLRGALEASPWARSSVVCASPSARSRTARIGQAGLIAAVVILAFGAGWLLRPEGDGHRPVIFQSASSDTARDENVKDQQADAARNGPENPVPEGQPEVRVAGTLTLEVEDHGQPRTVRVPVIEGRGIDVRWLLDQPPAIRASVVQALERRGHRVEAHRQLVTFNLKDGRKLILPVDEVDVQFAGRVFQ